MKKEEYLQVLTEQIRCRAARGPVRKEIKQHLEDQAEAFAELGMSKEEAETAAVEQMGDPVEAGGALDRIHRPQMAWGMLVLICALSAAGILAQYLIRKLVAADTAAAADFAGQCVRLLIGLGVMAVVCFLDYSRIGRHAKKISAVLYLLLVVGAAASGALPDALRLSLGAAAQAAALLLVPLYGAVLYSYRGQGYKALAKGLLWMLPGMASLLLLLPGALLPCLFLISCAVVLSLAVQRGWFCVSKKAVLPALWTGAAALLLSFGGWLLSFGGYRSARLQSAVNPAHPAAFQLRAIRGMLQRSRWIGAGAGAARLEDIGNYTLTYTIYCCGILAGVLLAGAVLFLFFRFFRVALRQKNQLGMMMGVGCAAVLTLQLALYVLDNLGVLSLTAYCPFLNSREGGMLVQYVLYGLMLSIYRYEKVLA